ncbi:3'-5' exonuclease [Paramagnetospirillum marisnigri]|uniref:3'-5' exonuclease n=1 Tax=Paramagnetospirillum marisnigri TaxID=1285242 RepID=A0A178MRC4_9PROT|nr:ribonuclease H-like domain-containing protein [Paramagnetospirillum marisnigri]OAN50658.1 3'-5' exonuclease [Paramagnetospirillum marisnigri]
MTVHYHLNDLPAGLDLGPVVAIDSETMGLNLHRDRLCVVQLSAGDGDAHVVHYPKPEWNSPNLVRMLADPKVVKLFHFARFDVAKLRHHFGVRIDPVFCTKIASRLTRTNTESHSLKTLVKEFLGIDLSKVQQSSDWGAPSLTEDQLAYAASDVLYLHQLKARFEILLDREGRRELAEACFRFLPDRAELDLAGWPEEDIFSH